MAASRKKSSDVFGVSHAILPDSYVDRGALDEQVARLLGRRTHIALRGASKCGKSWLRQSAISGAIVVQCRLGRTVRDLYVDALSQLGIRFETGGTETTDREATLEASGEVGIHLLARLSSKLGLSLKREEGRASVPVGHDIDDLRFIADLIAESGRRLVVEDLHYLSIPNRRQFAFDLKTLWDYGLFVIVIGVWSKQNMLIYLNPDLSGRVVEVPIVWNAEDLRAIFYKGGSALSLNFSAPFVERAVADCYENAGILQTLILGSLDRMGIDGEQERLTDVDDIDALEHAELEYAEQLNPLYQQFAERVAGGIRRRRDSTGIYGHLMAVAMAASDHELVNGLSLNTIFERAHARESRINKANLRSVLGRIEGMQVDGDGRGLILAYNDAVAELTVVDRQLLLYRKYSTVRWPWEELIEEASNGEGGYAADQEG